MVRRTAKGLWRGIERFIQLLIEAQRQRHEVHLFATGDSQVSPPNTLHVLFEKAMADEGLDRNAEVAQAMYCATEARKIGTELVHAYSIDSFLALTPFLGIPTVFTFCMLPDRSSQELSRLAEPYTRFTFISQQHRKQFPWLRRGDVVYQGLDLRMFPFQARKQPYLAFVGSIADKKGIIEAIEISRRAKLPLRIAARVKAQDKAFYEETVRPLLAANDHVTFLGEVSDEERNALLKQAKALLFPIKWEEPFGWVMVESLAVGTPVIAFNRGSVPEIIVDGTCGFIVENVAQAIQAVRQLDSIRPYDCRARVATTFSIEQTVERFEAIYREEVAAKPVTASCG